MRTRPVAVVTGGGRGIGLGIAECLAEAGFDLAVTDRETGGQVEASVSDLRVRGGEAILLGADLADLAGHAGTVACIVDKFGGIDCLVNNAGMASVERGDFLDLKAENFDAIVNVNLRGTMFFTQSVVKA